MISIADAARLCWFGAKSSAARARSVSEFSASLGGLNCAAECNGEWRGETAAGL